MAFTPVKQDDTGFSPISGFTPVEQESSLLDRVARPFRRMDEITNEEFHEGVNRVAKGLKLPASEVLSKLTKIGLGALQAGFSPLTGATRAFVGEPASDIALAAGASEETAGLIGTGAEVATELAIPGAILKGGARAISKGDKLVEQAIREPTGFRAATKPEDVLKTPGPTEVAGTDIKNVLDKFDSVDEIKNVFANSVKNIEGAVEESRRGIITWEQTEEAARLLAVDPKQLFSKAISAKAMKRGQAFNAEQLEGMKLVLKKATEEVHVAAKQALSGADADVLRFQQYMDRYYAAVQQFMGARAEAGRALNILRKEFGKTDDLKSIMDSLGGRDSLLDKAAIIARAETPEQIATAVRELQRAGISDVLMEAWINMLLSGPQTHVVNTLSNTLTSLWTVPEHLIASFMGKLHGGEKVYTSEVLPRLFGFFEGAKEGARSGVKSFLTEQPSDLFSKLEVARPRAIMAETFGATGAVGKAIDVVGQTIRIPGRALVAEDEFFKAIGYRMELNSLAMRDGLQKGLSGKELAQHIRGVVTNPSDEFRQQALDAARYVTFTKPLGEFGRSIQKATNAHPAAKLLAPFIRTPLNILKFAGERTPFAVFSKNVREEIRKGGAARDIALAKITMGTSLMSGIMAYAAEGRITGGGPSNQDARAALYRTGWQPYSIKIGDTYYSYARLEPLGVLFGVAADFAEIAGEIDEGEADKIAGMLVASVSKNITSKTWLRGVSDAIEAMEDPDRYAEQFIAGLSGTLVPTGVAQFTRTEDPILREARTPLDRIRSRIPGYSEDLSPRRNLWGEPIVLSGGFGPDLVSPIYTSEQKDDKVNDEIVRLEVDPSMPNRKIGGVELTAEEYDRYVQLSGAPAKRILDKIINTDSWDQIPDFKKKEVIEDMIKEHRKTATKLMVSRNPRKFKVEPELERSRQMKRDLERVQ